MKKVNLLSMAAALLLAATGCSDDLENGSGNNGIGDGNKSSAYMKVIVNTGVVTRAGEISQLPPTGGEDGDGNETGDVNEYIVRNVTVVLYKNVNEKDVNITTPSNATFSKDSKIVGVGYATTSGAMGTEDNEPNHSRSATVLVTATDEEDFDGNTYGMIAVTNWPKDGALKEWIQDNKSSLNATKLSNLLVENTYDTKQGNKFVMSSHLRSGETVTLHANATAETAPSTEVHVERLAAKVRINPTNVAGVNNYIYPINKEGETDDIAKVRLDKVALVNKLNSGSYLLKRVTPSDGATLETIPGLENDLWQGDEEAKTEDITGGVIYPGKNYVIDPWTRNKQLEGGNKVKLTVEAESNTDGVPTMMTAGAQVPQLGYDNPYKGETFTDLWGTLDSKAKKLSAEIESTASILIDYTMENTTSAVASKNGYSTGALFKATYLPKQWAEYGYNETEKKHYVKPVDIDYNGSGEQGTGYEDISQSTKGVTFYTYQRNVYKDIKAIFNEFVLGKQEDQNGKDGVTFYTYNSFLSENITKINIKEFVNSDFYKDIDTDPIGYFSYLRSYIIDLKKENNDQIPEGQTFPASYGIDDYLDSDVSDIYANVNRYDNGVTYYPYWIRHANNGKPTEMGIMEFGIVRNNIYDMTVSDVKALGLSGIEKPDPDKNDETKEYLFNVKIYVKDWVKRNNNNITLQ